MTWSRPDDNDQVAASGAAVVGMEAYFDGEAWCARGVDHDIFTDGATLEELRANIKEAVALHFEEVDRPIEIEVIFIENPYP